MRRKQKPIRLEKVVVPIPLDDTMFEKAAKQWEASGDKMAAAPRSINQQEVETMATFLLPNIPRDLAFVLFCDLAVDLPARSDLLEQIVDRGDVGCKVSVCLRPDLDPRLEEMCRTSPHESVREHYQSRVRCRQMGQTR
jgi:hypothetical protein